MTGNKVTRERWDRAIRYVPDPVKFFTSVGATELSYDEAVALINTMLNGLCDPMERFEIRQLGASAGVPDLCREVSQDSVVLFAFGGRTEVHDPGNHVAVAVAASAEPAVLHIACSAAFSSRHLSDGTYEERFHARLGRYSNDSIAANGTVEIAPNWRWRLTLVSKR